MHAAGRATAPEAPGPHRPKASAPAARAMRATLAALAVFGSFGLSGCRAPAPDPEPADLVLRGAAIHTMSPERPRAEAIAVARGRIVYVGDDAGAAAWIGAGTEILELPGRMVLPAFQDAHVHPLAGGVELGDCDLNAMRSAGEVLARIAECAAADPGAPWLRGGGFQLPHFPGGAPTAAALDAVEPARPAFFTSADGHSAWVNGAALRLAGITAATPDPPAGRIERDPATGAPLGTLRESAMDLVARHLPPRSPAELEAGLARGLAMAASFGITALQEASADQPALAAYAALERRGELTARVSVSLFADPAGGLDQVERLSELRRRHERGDLRVGTVKLFADGVLEGQTAALLAPYLGRGGDAGELTAGPEPLAALVAALDAAGFQVHVHAIGDRAIRVTLDAFERARRENGARDARHHMAHVQLFDPADIPRLAELGVAANFQPLWAWADPYITDLTEPFLGSERSRWLYPIASVKRSGARVVFGSDWSVSSMNPLLGIEVGVTRKDPENPSAASWIPEERVDLQTMLHGYTAAAAWVNFLEEETGTLEVGKSADLVVLERDLFAIPPEEIGETAVLLSLLRGEPVYRAAGRAGAPPP